MGGHWAQLAEASEPLFAWGQVKAHLRGAQKGRLPIVFFPYLWDEELYGSGRGKVIFVLPVVCSSAC